MESRKILLARLYAAGLISEEEAFEDKTIPFNMVSRYGNSEVRHASAPGESKHKCTRKPKKRKKNKKTHR